jgi:hypothetical protein
MDTQNKHTPDMSKREFESALKRRGFKYTGFLGYVDVGDGLHVCPRNAGTNRRAQLAYLIRKKEEIESQLAKATGGQK